MAAWEEDGDDVKMKHMLDASSPVKDPMAYIDHYEHVPGDDTSDSEQKDGGSSSFEESGEG